jgi:hypothetical protein
MYEAVWDKIMETCCKYAVIEILKVYRKYYNSDIAIYIGKFLWNLRKQFIEHVIRYTGGRRSYGDKVYIGFIYDKTSNLYQLSLPSKNNIPLINKNVPNDIISLYNKWIPHIDKKRYTILENVSYPTTAHGSIMYGYCYVSKNSHYYSGDMNIYIDDLKLSNINVDKCCTTKYNKFVGILLNNVKNIRSDKDASDNAVALSEIYTDIIYIPTFNDIIDTMINNINSCYLSGTQPHYIKSEIAELKNIDYIPYPTITFIPRKCHCCPNY